MTLCIFLYPGMMFSSIQFAYAPVLGADQCRPESVGLCDFQV